MDIKSVIQNHGFQIQDIAKKMEVKQSTLSGMLSGNPTIGTLRKIAEAADCSVAEFFLDELSREQVAEMFGLVVPPEPEPEAEEVVVEPEQPEPTPQERPEADEEHTPVGTALVGLVRCPQCGRAIRLFAEE